MKINFLPVLVWAFANPDQVKGVKPDHFMTCFCTLVLEKISDYSCRGDLYRLSRFHLSSFMCVFSSSLPTASFTLLKTWYKHNDCILAWMWMVEQLSFLCWNFECSLNTNMHHITCCLTIALCENHTHFMWHRLVACIWLWFFWLPVWLEREVFFKHHYEDHLWCLLFVGQRPS